MKGEIFWYIIYLIQSFLDKISKQRTKLWPYPLQLLMLWNNRHIYFHFTYFVGSFLIYFHVYIHTFMYVYNIPAGERTYCTCFLMKPVWTKRIWLHLWFKDCLVSRRNTWLWHSVSSRYWKHCLLRPLQGSFNNTANKHPPQRLGTCSMHHLSGQTREKASICLNARCP